MPYAEAAASKLRRLALAAVSRGTRMAFFRRRLAEVIEDEHPDAGSQTGLGAFPVDLSADVVQTAVFALTNFVQRVPHLGFEPDAGPPVRECNVPANKRRHLAQKNSLGEI